MTSIYQSINDDLSRLVDDSKQEIANLDSRLKEITAESDYFFDNQDEYLSSGRPADGEIDLPLGNNKNQLNAEAMLSKMRKIIDSGSAYDLLSHNCSSTSLSILKAGQRGATLSLSSTFNPVVTPQLLYNEASKIRDKINSQSISESINNLEGFYSSIPSDVRENFPAIRQEHPDINTAILTFAVENIFPEESDRTFHLFSENDKKKLEILKDTVVETSLLKDLWGIIPERKLPLTDDGSICARVDKNLSIKNLVQGLTILAKINAKERFGLQDIPSSEKNAVVPLKQPSVKDGLRFFKAKIASLPQRPAVMLTGDKLRKKILVDFQKSLTGLTEQELDAAVANFKASDEYKILQKGQDPMLASVGQETSCLQEMNQIISDARTALDDDKRLTNPTAF